MSKPMTIGILECGAPDPTSVFASCNYADWFEELFGTVVPNAIRFKRYAAYRNEIPTLQTSSDCWLVTGSSSGVLDRLPRMHTLQQFIHSAATQSKIIGVCFGHQLIADAFGGRVERSPHG